MHLPKQVGWRANPLGAKARFNSETLRGPEGPLFHGVTRRGVIGSLHPNLDHGRMPMRPHSCQLHFIIVGLVIHWS